MTDNKPRRPYQAPTLQVYGDLTRLTLNAVTDNMNDKGNGSFSMT
jgi:hypothetical protein